MVNQDRNVFAACGCKWTCRWDGHRGDPLLYLSFSHVTRVIEPKPEQRFVTTSMLISRGRTVFMGDTSIYERPEGEKIAEIAQAIAHQARTMGHTPRVALFIFLEFWQSAGCPGAICA